MKDVRQALIHQLAEWDQLIRGGQATLVRQHCRSLNHRVIPRDLIMQYADIARRVSAPELILLWLRPWVRSEKLAGPVPSDKEKAMYGLGLLRLGAFREAKKLFEKVSPEQEPQVHFYQASLYINQWNYAKAIPKLKKYIRDPAVPAYSKLVGRLNLCASLVSSQNLVEAEIQINALFKKLKQSSQSLLRGNLLEIQAQLFIEQKKYDKALVNLNEALSLLKTADSRSRLYVEKWQWITSLRLNGGTSDLFEKMKLLKRKAKAINDYESLREFDFAWAIAKQDAALFQNVYWGSLFSQYRSRILKVFISELGLKNSELHIGEKFIWCPIEDDSIKSLKPIELISQVPTKTLKKLFFILTQEFYRPIRTTEITDYLYPNEYYNPKSSPEKLRRLITRAREWLVANSIPLQIKSYRNSYKIEAIRPCQIVLHKKLILENEEELSLSLQSQKVFTCDEWARDNNVSSRTARRMLLRLTQQGRIQKLYYGPLTRYKIL